MSTIKMDSIRKKKLKKLAKMMNKQTTRPVPTFIGATIKVLDSVLTTDEIEFLLAMGTERYKLISLEKLINLPKNEFSKVFNNLLQKGLIWSQPSESNGDLFEISYEKALILNIEVEKSIKEKIRLAIFFLLDIYNI